MPIILKKYYPLRNILFFVGEGLLIFIAAGGVYLFFKGLDACFANLPLCLLRVALVTLIFQICLYYFDLYDLNLNSSFSDTASRVTMAFGFGCIALSAAYYLFPATVISTHVFLVGYVAICGAVAVWRFFYGVILDRRLFARPVLVVGGGRLASRISSEIDSKRGAAYKIAAYVSEKRPGHNPHKAPVFHDLGDLLKIAQKLKVEKIVLALDDMRGKTPVKELMLCKVHGFKIVSGVHFFEELTGKILVEKVNPSWIIFSDGFKKGRMTLLAKRIIDILLSFIGLIVTLPLTLATALIIKLESPGPVFYTQKRVGERGRVYRVIKFRSMREDAEKNGPMWATENDERVTRCGRFIRKTRLDEIPQLWTVLKGEMSLVGPRPERPAFVEQLVINIPYYYLRHYVKPGITGWAQVLYPYGASEEDALHKLEYDLYYLEHRTVFMDLWIIFQTIKIVLLRKGAR